jgi:hypothetical protein
LDHKIKYKKSIPNRLKRRINTLAALFELADREFREIRDATEDEIKKAEVEVVVEVEDSAPVAHGEPLAENPSTMLGSSSPLDAFSFLRIAHHFFGSYEFEPHKVDGFTQEICCQEPGVTKRNFNFYMRETIARVKKYQAFIEGQAGKDQFYPFTVIRHCLYLARPEIFKSMLTNSAREKFEGWLKNDVAHSI